MEKSIKNHYRMHWAIGIQRYLIVCLVMPEYLMPFLSYGQNLKLLNSCVDSLCGANTEVNYIRLYYPEQGSQLLMNQTRIRYDVHEAPMGSYSRIFLNGIALDIYHAGWKQTTFANANVDMALQLGPGFWTLKVFYSKCIQSRLDSHDYLIKLSILNLGSLVRCRKYLALRVHSTL